MDALDPPESNSASEDVEAQARSSSRNALPLSHQFEEARRAARFFARHWHTRRDGRTGTILLPGLETVASARLPRSTGEQIASLIAATASAHEDYVRTLCGHADLDLVAEAHWVLWELRSVLEWIADEVLNDDDANELRAFLRDAWRVDDTPRALAQALARHAAMVRDNLAFVTRLKNFDLRELERARDLEQALSQLFRDGASARPETERALATRNRLLTLLHERVRRVHAASRFVFRHHPEIRAELVA